jgi:epoxyqueuosine reductase
MEPGWVAHPDAWAGARSVLVCALSCRRDEPDDLSSPGDPHALIAPFARRGHYAAAAGMMRALLRRLGQEAGFGAREARIFVNSRIPEKPLLAATGLASYGKNGLLIIPGLGSLFVIAGCVLPFQAAGPLAPAESDPPGFSPCGSCGQCITACPVGAIVEPGVVDPDRCLQGLAERPILLASDVMERWGCRLYGCQDCQSVCPRNAGLTENAPACPTEIGPSVSIRRILTRGIDGVKGMFRGTPMGMSRISPVALLRNAIIAAGNRGDPVLRKEIEGYQGHGETVLRETALWALARIAPSCR